MFNFLVYIVWVCLKGMTLYNTLKEEPSNKNHFNDKYNLVYSDTQIKIQFLKTLKIKIYFRNRTLMLVVLRYDTFVLLCKTLLDTNPHRCMQNHP